MPLYGDFPAPKVALCSMQKDEGAARFCDAEQLLTGAGEHCPACQQLIPLAHAALPAVCDAKQADGCSYFRVNQRKV